MQQDTSPSLLLELTTEIVNNYTASIQPKNFAIADLELLIKTVFNTLTQLQQASAQVTLNNVPAVPISDSIQHNHIICLEDGKKFKSIKRHLKAAHNLTGYEYKKRWNLPADYPLVSREYGDKRSGIAKKVGLGGKKPKIVHQEKTAKIKGTLSPFKKVNSSK